MSGLTHSTYVSIDNKAVVPECITRYGVGTRVELRALRGGSYAVQPIEGDSMRIFGEETWRPASV